MSYASFDLETTIKSALKRKASPFYGLNRTIAVGYRKKGAAVKPEHLYDVAGVADGYFAAVLEGVLLLVGFNIKFDLLHALCLGPLNRAAYSAFIKRGGRVWDGQLGEYLLHGMAQEVQMISLDETAPRYGGNLKNDAVKALWNAGVDTDEIDRDMLLDYLIGTLHREDVPAHERDRGDIGNTEAVMLGQIAAFRARGGLQSALLNMDALLFTVEAEYNGMFIDKERGLELAAALKIEIAELTDRLQQYLPELPPELEFSWSNRYHLSPLVFGGQIKYKAKALILDEAGNKTYVQKDELHYVLKDGTTTATAPGGDIDFMKYETFAGGKNKGEFKTKKVKGPDIEKGPKTRYEDFFQTFKGYTEPDPKWVSSSDGPNGSKLYSVAADIIVELGVRNIPFLKDLAKLAALTKDMTTYYISTDEETGESKGMLTLVGEDGLLHHKLNMTNTITARLSSSDPNLQNVSGSAKSQVKSVFVSRWGKDGVIIQSDFTSLEIYIQAWLTGDRQMIADLWAGMDMHCKRLAAKLGMDYDVVYKRYKDGDKDIAKGRKGSKEYSFQSAYGAGDAAIAASTGMPVEEVAAIREADNKLYPGVGVYYDAITATIKRNRVPTQRFKPHPDVPGAMCQLGKSHFSTPDGKLYSFNESPSPAWIAKKPQSKGGCFQSFSPTEIKNYPVQGTGGEVAKVAMHLAFRAFNERDNFGGLALLVNQVHDALYVDAHKSVWLEAAALLEACMLEASTYISWYFKWDIPVPVPTETKWGSSMIEELDMPEGHAERVKTYRAEVRAKYISNHIPQYEKEKNHGI